MLLNNKSELDKFKSDDELVRVKVNKDVFTFAGGINYEKISDKFSDFELISVTNLTQKRWLEVTLKRLDYTYCEDISSGLDLFSITRNEVKDYCKITKTNCLCLSECWMPYAWSVIRNRENSRLNHLTIIHIDDHSDLMPPLISYNGVWRKDLLTQQQVHFSAPASIKASVKSGAIPIGSMLTPIVKSVENFTVLHLKQNVIERKQFEMKFEAVQDIAFYKKTQRLNIKYLPVNPGTKCNNVYVKTSEIFDLFKFIDKSSRILLHIDMDYFNNRFNGSTSWAQEKQFSHDPEMAVQKKVISTLCKTLGKMNKIHPFDYIFIGVSPSFYPTEFWRSGLYYLFEMLISNGIDVNDLSKFIKNC